MKILILLMILCPFGSVFGQIEKVARAGIVNGKAKYLPIPEYPPEARNSCAGGVVKVEVLIDKKGNVIEASAISGDKILHDSAVKAAKEAIFHQTLDRIPTKVRGILIYNFDDFSRCLKVGIVNDRALSLPKPKVDSIFQRKILKLTKDEIVAVQIVVQESGKVTYAKALSGNLLLRSVCESAAIEANFPPSLINGPPIRVKALLIYKIKPDGNVDTNIEQNDKTVIGTAITLIEPIIPCCKFRLGGTVSVAAKINEQGNVVDARGLSGHPLLKELSRQAALKSSFLPTDVKAKIVLKYNFESSEQENGCVKPKNIEVVRVDIF